MKLSKESKVRVLETFYALDHLFFGKPVSEIGTCCPAFQEEYQTVKGALLSVVIEMLRMMKHSPKPLTEAVNSKSLQQMAVKSAKIARENCKRLVATEKGKEEVKAMIHETLSKAKKSDKVNMEGLVQAKIREKSFALGVDNLVIARNLLEARDVKALNSWKGKISEDAYKTLRDGLVECAISILENAD
jgi:hypothetical protein